MSSPPSSSSTTTPPLALPAPGWLFFVENLPLLETAPAAIEDTVVLSLESHAPLPVEQLAFGWTSDPARKTVSYYAGARERLRPALNGDYDRAGYVVPDFVLAPPGAPGVWQWLATPQALTAVRAGNAGVEVRSWPLPPVSSEALSGVAKTERAAREGALPGEHATEVLVWDGVAARERGKHLLCAWRAGNAGGVKNATFPLEVLWRADVRDRAWLAASRKIRTKTGLFNRLLWGAVAGLGAVLLAGAALFVYQGKLTDKKAVAAVRAQEVDALMAKLDLVGRLDQMAAGQVSFYDALATMNHYRPTDILFTRAIIDGSRRVQVSGTAATIGQINTYVEALRNNGAFSQVETTRIATNEGRTTFDLRLTVGALAVSRSTPEGLEDIMQPGDTPTPTEGVATASDASVQEGVSRAREWRQASTEEVMANRRPGDVMVMGSQMEPSEDGTPRPASVSAISPVNGTGAVRTFLLDENGRPVEVAAPPPPVENAPANPAVTP